MANVWGLDKEEPTKALLDPGSMADIISQSYALRMKLLLVHTTLPDMLMADDAPSYCYGAYMVKIQVEDSLGRRRADERLFYAVDRRDPLILGMPYCHDNGVVIDCEAKQFRWKYDQDSMKIEDPHTFARTLQGESRAFALIVSHAGNPESSTARVRGVTGDSPTIPRELHEYEDVFSEHEASKLPTFEHGSHPIETTIDPPYGPLYSLSRSELEVLRAYINDSLEKGWIRHSTSPAGAPVIFVPKKDGSLRLCVDYRGLNSVTIKNRHPLPLISETLDRLVGAKLFTKLDLQHAYHRVRIREGDEWKTAFRTRYGHFEYLVMPFGLTNAPATFQAYINRALADVVDIFCVVYLDDILIFSDSLEAHWGHVKQVLERLRHHNLYVKLSKCTFASSEVEFLGFLVNTQGIKMDPERIRTIAEWPTPRTFRDVQVFLGFANFYRRFILGYSKVAGALTTLLKGSKDGRKAGLMEWLKPQQSAFEALKSAFTTAPVLRHFDPTRRIRVETDASVFAVGAILSQLFEDEQWHPVAFWSRKMIPAETNYETYDQELLAIVASFKHWRHYLEGSAFPVEVLTDHNNLRGFMNHKQMTRRQARWCLTLSTVDFVIGHRPGLSNPADGPSRRPDYEDAGVGAANQLLPTLFSKLSLGASCNNVVVEPSVRQSLRQWCHDHYPTRVDAVLERTPWCPAPGMFAGQATSQSGLVPRCCAVTRAEASLALADEDPANLEDTSSKKTIQQLQKEDALCQRMRADVKQSKTLRKPWRFDGEGILRHKNSFYVPDSATLRQSIITRCHDDPMSGHFGREKTLDLVQRKFHWPHVANDVANYVRTCDICQRVRVHRHRPYGVLQPLPIPTKPFEEVTVDFITKLPPSVYNDHVYDAIMVTVDRYTKFAKYLPCTVTMTAVEFADVWIDHIVANHGSPLGIVSDRGSIFTSGFWRTFCYTLMMKRRLSTAYHPQTDGETERQNQTLEHYLRVYATERQDNWASLLPLAQYAYNNSIHSTTGISPFFALYGYHPTINFEIEDDLSKKGVPTAEERAKSLHSTREQLEKHWQNVVESQSKYYNQHHSPMAYKAGDLVMLSTKNLRVRQPSKKLAHRLLGPFAVEETVGTQAYRIHLPKEWKVHPTFHVSLLEPYHQRETGEYIPNTAPPELLNNEQVWEIEEVLAKTTRKGTIHYLVKWKGWTSNFNQWVAADDMQAPKAISEYEKALGQGNPGNTPANRRGRPRKAKSSQ